MNAFQLSLLRNSSVWGLYRLKEKVEMDPVYQREGDIWNQDKRQLLIDTIINQFDIPKIYLHKFPLTVEKNGKCYEYAVIDGKQRLNAIWGFIDGKFPLSSNFEYLRPEESESVDAAGLTYADLARKYPNLKTDFDSYLLDVVSIETDDTEIIEELFSRLNEAVPLSAAEKRNALSGPLPCAVRTIVGHSFFKDKLPFSNKRSRHYDIAAKMLLVTHRNDITDTKKAYLDRFFDDNKKNAENIDAHIAEIKTILDAMSDLFIDSDPLLRQVGMTLLYFHLFRRAFKLEFLEIINRESLAKFDLLRRENKKAAENDISESNYDLLEFDRYTQSPNDAFAMRFRAWVLDQNIFEGRLGFDLKPHS